MLEEMREKILEIRKYIAGAILDILAIVWLGVIIILSPILGTRILCPLVIPLNKILLTLFGENFVSRWALTTNIVCTSNPYYEVANTCIRLAIVWSVFFLTIGMIILLLSLFIRKKTK